MRHMFYGCQKLTSLDVSHFDTSNVTDMYGTFQALFELLNLDVSGFNTSKVTTMVWMFGNCHKLQALDVSGFDTSNVTDMTFMFAGCNDLSNIDVSGFDTKKVTRMTEMFGSCKTLTALDVTNFNTANVYNFDYMFSGCTGLTSLDVSHFDTSNAVSMTDMFGSCYGLTTLDVSHFNTSKVTNMNSLFRNCTNLLDINMSNFNTANVTDMADIFTECTSLASIQAGSAMIPANEYAKVENPNLLLYVNDASLAPQSIRNVVVNDFAKNIVLTDVESGNNNFYCPKEFKAEMISYTRNFLQQTEIGVSRGWESIALPFNVQTIMHEKQGLIAPFGNDASGKHFWLRQLTQEGVARATAIEANTPYIISMPNNNEYPAEFNLAGRVTFSAQDAFVTQTEINVMETHDVNGNLVMFVPCFQSQSAEEQVYALNVGDAQVGYAEGSVFVAGLREVRPFEAYTWHHAHGPAPRYIPISELDGGATGIEDVRSLMSDGRGDSWYDLNGRRLQKKPTQKGV
jgi:surface protein